MPVDRPDKPTVVLLGIYVNSFYSISEQTMVRLRKFFIHPKNDSIRQRKNKTSKTRNSAIAEGPRDALR